jgi:3-oxoacyl-[acyl-carrier-protein] synthase II
VSPLGSASDAHWRQLLEGRLAVRSLPELAGPSIGGPPADGWSNWSGAPAAGFPVVPPADVLSRMALRAAGEALADAGLELPGDIPMERVGCVLGVSKPMGLSANSDPRADDDHLAIHRPSQSLASEHGVRGPVLVPSAACATGLISLIRGAALIRDATCDAVLAGSSDWSLSPGYLAGYRRLGVLAKAVGDPATACRPYDRRRSGFVVGCGAGVLVLEDWERARQRGAAIHAEWLGSALAGDAFSMVDVATSGETPARVIRDALRRSGLRPADLDAVSLHGTGTRANDVAETAALHRALGETAGRVSCFSLKGSIGHLLGAAGSVETATLVRALRSQIVPPTMNLEQPDPQCDLDYTPGRPRPRAIRHALKLSLGFGGACAAAILRWPGVEP